MGYHIEGFNNSSEALLKIFRCHDSVNPRGPGGGDIDSMTEYRKTKYRTTKYRMQNIESQNIDVAEYRKRKTSNRKI